MPKSAGDSMRNLAMSARTIGIWPALELDAKGIRPTTVAVSRSPLDTKGQRGTDAERRSGRSFA